jgi:hypothetical protein
MGRPDLVVAVGYDEKRRDGVDAATNEPEELQARLVGSMDVLQCQDCGTAGITDALDELA